MARFGLPRTSCERCFMKPCADCGPELENAAVNSGECSTAELGEFPKRPSRDPQGRRTRKPPQRSARAANQSRGTMQPARVKRSGLFGFKSLFCPDCGADIRPFLEATICPCCARPLTEGEPKPQDEGKFAESQPITRPANDPSRREEQMAAQTVGAPIEPQTKLASNARKWLLGFAGIVVLLVIVGTIVGLSYFSNNRAPSRGASTSQVTKSDVSRH